MTDKLLIDKGVFNKEDRCCNTGENLHSRFARHFQEFLRLEAAITFMNYVEALCYKPEGRGLDSR
jgi:hypothetical protein